MADESSAKPVLLADSAQAFQLWHGELAREMNESDGLLKSRVKEVMPRSAAGVYAVASFMAAWGSNGVDSFPGERLLREALGMNRNTVRDARRVLVETGWLSITGKKKGPNGESNVYRISIPASRWQSGWAKFKMQGAEAPEPKRTDPPPKRPQKQEAKPKDIAGPTSPEPITPTRTPSPEPSCEACDRGDAQAGFHHTCKLRDPFYYVTQRLQGN